MAIISNFELLVKRIGPPGGIPPVLPGINDPLRRLLQGYYLTISNPNERLASLRAHAVYPSLDPNSPFGINDRELVGGASANHVYAYDRTGNNTTSANPRELLGSLGIWTAKNEAKTSTTATFQVDCHQTGLINIVPDPASSILPDPQLEIRGYTKIVQVKEIKIIKVGKIYYIVFVTPPPIDLLVTPEIRGTFLDNLYTNTSNDLDFDQSNYALPTASGGAFVTVSECVNPFFFPVTPIHAFNSFAVGEDGYINPGSLIESKQLSGTMNLAGQFSLNDESIESVQAILKKIEGIRFSLKQIISSIEATINEFGILGDERDEQT